MTCNHCHVETKTIKGLCPACYHRQRRAQESKPAPKKWVRTCLKCGENFTAKTRFYRVCPGCRAQNQATQSYIAQGMGIDECGRHHYVTVVF
jgi:hypothetical protein